MGLQQDVWIYAVGGDHLHCLPKHATTVRTMPGNILWSPVSGQRGAGEPALWELVGALDNLHNMILLRHHETPRNRIQKLVPEPLVVVMVLMMKYDDDGHRCCDCDIPNDVGWFCGSDY